MVMHNKQHCEQYLLIGSETAISGGDRVLRAEYVTHCFTMEQGQSACQERCFDTIYVVLSEVGPDFKTALCSLRRVAAESKIILLAQMLEEPLALNLINISRRAAGGALADDYMIAPVSFETLTNGQSMQEADPLFRKHYETLLEKDQQIQQLEVLVTQDDLTGLKNRRYMRLFLEQILEQARENGLRVTLLVFDIDNFKHYNDTFGHTVGDNVLKQAAVMIQNCCREHDIVARIGGDEFAVVFWDLPNGQSPQPCDESERRSLAIEHPREPLFMAERFRKTISETNFEFLGSKGKGTLTISGGLASFPVDGMDTEELFIQADKAMFEAKNNGKNRIHLVGAQLNANAS